MKVVVLSGGVGGARFVLGVVDAIDPRDVTVIGNVGDDVEVLGLHVSPDLDSILYALAGLNDEERGWGRAGETWNALESVRALGGEGWFALGDRDLGVHLVRTQALRAGEPLSAVTARLASSLGVATTLLPATDDELRTWIDTAGRLVPVPGVVRRARASRRGRRASDSRAPSAAAPAAGRARRDRAQPTCCSSRRATRSSRSTRSSPSRAIRDALARRRVPCVAVSPLIGGRAVKGPADRMLTRLAGGTSPRHVAGCYSGLIDAIVVDEADADDLDGLDGVQPIVARTLMVDADARRRLAEAALGGVPA